MKYPRFLKESLLQSFDTSPVTLLIGPRQSGKTTLMSEIGKTRDMNYLTFDTLKQLVAAQEDPEGFIASVQKPLIIDEVQRVPEIALPIKLAVDQKRKPGMFGLTGSANPLVAPKLNDSLAGRMFILHMWPLSIGEIQGKKPSFLEWIFDADKAMGSGEAWSKNQMVATFSAGGYPNALSLDPIMRDRWYDNLLTTILERDVADIAHIAKPRDFAKLLHILAARVSSLLNLSEISRVSAIPYTTLNHYMTILESLFLVVRLPPWTVNRTKRFTKMPKFYFGDTGLLLNQLKVDETAILNNPRILGHILENFVFLELKKQSSWALKPLDLYYFRTQSGAEVDFVLENRSGQIVGIEIKASETIHADDWKGMNALADEVGEKMVRSLIFYPGKEIVAFGKNRHAVPLSLLWN